MKPSVPFERLAQVSYPHRNTVYKYESNFYMLVPLNKLRCTSEERVMIFFCGEEGSFGRVTRLWHVQNFWFPIVLPTALGPKQTFISDTENHCSIKYCY